MPPKWSLGYHQCRWSYTSDKRVLEVAKTFRDKSIPCDVIWMDIDYMDGFRCFTFDNKRFSDPKSLVKDHHLNGIKAIWMLDPGIKHENSTDSGTEGSGDQSDDSTARKIKELIDVLDLRKDESIERTFKGVARNFREVFSELVQGGHGVLVMMKKKDGDQGDDEDDDGPRDTEAERRVEKYIGVKVKVSFTGQGETQSMKQLSGGQKTVVALALIFAIQRCDPAPFIFLMKLMQPLILSTELPLEFRLFADNSLCQFRFSPCKQ